MNEIFIRNIISFLTARGWSLIDENEKFLKYLPPSSFEFEEGYKLSIPKDSTAVDIGDYLNNISRILSELYQINFEDIKILFSDNNTIFALKIEDDEIDEGKILLPKFEILIEKLKKILLDTASFVVIKRPLLEHTPEEATRYLNQCKFLQTEKGSFIAKVELPQNKVLREADLIPESEILSDEVNKKLMNVIRFVSEEVITESNFDTDYLIQNEDKINYQVLKQIQEFYLNTEIENIKYSFINNTYEESFKVVDFNSEKKDNLNNFIIAVKNKLFNEFEIDVKAVIYELKSKDPDRNNNLIKLSAIVRDVVSMISLTLDNEFYKIAVDAHKNKRYVRLRAKVKEEMTQYRVLELFEFIVREQIVNN